MNAALNFLIGNSVAVCFVFLVVVILRWLLPVSYTHLDVYKRQFFFYRFLQRRQALSLEQHA